jgi:hypothetical protein
MAHGEPRELEAQAERRGSCANPTGHRRNSDVLLSRCRLAVTRAERLAGVVKRHGRIRRAVRSLASRHLVSPRRFDLVTARRRYSSPKASAGIVASVALACAVSACSGGTSKSSSLPASGSSRSLSPPAAETGAGASAPAGRVRELPSVGDVVVRSDPREGTVIRDGATHGKRFLLTGIQASECLSYLNANPAAPARDVRAACPGEVAVAKRKKVSQPSKTH